MTFKREQWKIPFGDITSPDWPCPGCGRHTLRVVEDSLSSVETRQSKNGRAHEDWDPSWLEYRWTIHLRCSASQCGEEVVALGTETAELERDFDLNEEIMAPRYHPLYCEPPIHLVELPDDLREDVRTPLIECFRLYWRSPTSAIGRIRVALERYLDSKRIPRKKRRANGRMVRQSLHERIRAFGDKKGNEELGKSLLALKWIGNEASHDEGLTHDDVLDALEILEEALHHMSGRRARVGKLRDKAIKQKGRPRDRKR